VINDKTVLDGCGKIVSANRSQWKNLNSDREKTEYKDIPKIDITGCPILGEGANGIVYQIDEDRIVKVMKQPVPFDDLIKEWDLGRKAFVHGIDCPISYGPAWVDGKPALISELSKSVSWLKLIRQDPSNMERFMDAYVALIRQVHSIKGEELKDFPKGTAMEELFEKADRLDAWLKPEYRGWLKKILESVGGEPVLTHGDIQPRNVRIGEKGAMLIDMETLSAGPAVLDLSALRRTMFSDWEYGREERNTFLDLSAEESRRFWDMFTEAYFEGQDKKEEDRQRFYAEAIGHIRSVSKMQRRNVVGAEAENGIRKLEEIIDRWKNAGTESRKSD